MSKATGQIHEEDNIQILEIPSSQALCILPQTKRSLLIREAINRTLIQVLTRKAERGNLVIDKSTVKNEMECVVYCLVQ